MGTFQGNNWLPMTMEQQRDELRKLLAASGTKGLIGPDTRTFRERMTDMGQTYVPSEKVYPLGTAPANSMDAWDRRLLGEKPAPLTREEFGAPLTADELSVVEKATGMAQREAAPAAAPETPATAVAPVEDWTSEQAKQWNNWNTPATAAPAPTAPSPMAASGIPMPESALSGSASQAINTFEKSLAPAAAEAAAPAVAAAAPVAEAVKDFSNGGFGKAAAGLGALGGVLKSTGSVNPAGIASAAAAGSAGGPMGMMAGVGASLLGSLLSKVLSPDPAPEPVDTLDLQPAAPYEAPEPPTFADARDVDRRLFGWA